MNFKEEFSNFVYEKHRTSLWNNHYVNKCPTDLWKLQEIITRIKPDIFIETGTEGGGSAIYFSDLLRLLDHGKVITIDIKPLAQTKMRSDITYLVGDSTWVGMLQLVDKIIEPGNVVMVDLDSNHTKEHVLKELNAYGPLVTHDSYLIVEDGNLNGHPVLPDWGEGPFEALTEWLPKHPEFKNDDELEAKYGMTYFTGGWLRRVH